MHEPDPQFPIVLRVLVSRDVKLCVRDDELAPELKDPGIMKPQPRSRRTSERRELPPSRAVVQGRGPVPIHTRARIRSQLKALRFLPQN